MPPLRFCAYQYQNLPLHLLRQRWQDAERRGFDVLWNCDTVVDPDQPGNVMFDGPATLVLMAAATEHIRVGTLVSSLYFRHPVTLAKATVAVDHATDGRVELALGVGDPSAGGAAAGVAWSAAERGAQFAEFVELTDLLLREPVTTYDGTYYRCRSAESMPPPVQSPRPPITIAAHGPKMLRTAARYADSWSSWGGYGVETVDEFYAVTADRRATFDDLCVGFGRDPGGVRHSLVCFPPLTPWESVDYFTDMVGRLSGIGIDELVLYWPETWRRHAREREVFDDVTSTAMPAMQRAAVPPPQRSRSTTTGAWSLGPLPLRASRST
jgi:alkanesulfonate monooxygenase SsuD/methylene tetrahydromethanopterin reductase-like flavin-dependent oxidoreductase (luciferase family)